MTWSKLEGNLTNSEVAVLFDMPDVKVVDLDVVVCSRRFGTGRVDEDDSAVAIRKSLHENASNDADLTLDDEVDEIFVLPVRVDCLQSATRRLRKRLTNMAACLVSVVDSAAL